MRVRRHSHKMSTAFFKNWTSIQDMLCCCISSILSCKKRRNHQGLAVIELSYHFNYFDHAVKLILEFERLKVVHVAVAVEEIALQGRPRFVLQREQSDRIKKSFSRLLFRDMVILPTWESRAVLASSSSYLLQLYHEVPWGAQGPRQTQQKSARQA